MRLLNPQHDRSSVLEGAADCLPHVYRFALRLTGDRHQAEDLTQETMLRVCQTRSQLRDERAVRVWLFRTVANLWKDSLRRAGSGASKTQSLAGRCIDQITASDPTPDQKIETREELERALKQLDALPTRQRTVLYLIAVEELTLSEVGEILQIEKNAAKVSLSLARRKMREERSRSE